MNITARYMCVDRCDTAARRHTIDLGDTSIRTTDCVSTCEILLLEPLLLDCVRKDRT